MGTTYTRAAAGIVQVVEEVMAETYLELAAHGVTVETLLAWNGEREPLRLHGYPAHAIIKVNGLKDRAAGLADCRLLIDGRGWEDWSQQQRVALIDHELRHLELVKDREGHVKTDDCARPRLRVRPHDWQIGGFDDVVQRHGIEAFEAQSFRDLHRHLTQMKFPWG